MVPTRYFIFIPAAASSSSAVLTTTLLTYFSSFTSPTNGIKGSQAPCSSRVTLLDIDGGIG